MPAGKGTDSGGSDAKDNAAQRTTFRPPWVKDGPKALPVPTAPWTLKNTPRKDSATSETTSDNPLAGVQLRKISKETNNKEPQENGSKERTFKRPQLKPVPKEEKAAPKESSEPQENGSKENTFKRPQLKPVPPKEEKVITKENKLPPVKLNSVAERRLSDAKKPPLNRTKTQQQDEEIDRAIPATRHALVREESMRRISQAPAPPPLPPPPPAMPGQEKKKQLSQEQLARIEALKARPKNRPDWTAMLKEIEGNKKLKHVETNDRSQPLLPEVKTTDHFLYESEKPNVHNELLKQIQFGIHLKKVKTNDRSRPILEGLRKFRRQMTIEEQIQKSVSMASMPPEEIADEVDEMDDIDKVRDDLQSTKQMLALELRNKEAQIRENKRLLSRIQNLEAELENERNRTDKGSGGGGGNSTDAEEKLIKSLKTEAQEARKTTAELEKKFTETAEQLDSTKFQLEDIRKRNQDLEKKLQDALQAGKRHSISDRKDSMANGKEDSDLDFEEEELSESDGEDTPEKREKRAQRELKTLRNKLRNFKNKEDNAKKERIALREIIKKHQHAMKEEKKKYKALKKEVDKMAAMMKDVGEDEDEEVEEEEEEEDKEGSEEETEEESSEESESEESEDETEEEESESEDEDASIEDKKENLIERIKRHENILAALKKGNYLLKTNAERLQDDLNKQKEMTAALQEDLDSVLAELG